MVSQRFRVAVKVDEKPAWKIARDAGVNPSTLSKIVIGFIDAKPGDKRVEAVAKILDLAPDECYEPRQSGGE